MLLVGAATGPGCTEAYPSPDRAENTGDGSGGAEIDLVDAGRPNPGSQATVLAPERECEESGREARFEFDQDWQNPDKDRRYTQLYMAPVTVSDGEVTTYPALYLWNQDQDTSNYTPAWDDFNIPEVPPPIEVW
jgi:hypothetical protein